MAPPFGLRIARSNDNLSYFTSRTVPLLKTLDELISRSIPDGTVLPAVVGMIPLAHLLRRDYGWTRQCAVFGQGAWGYATALAVISHPSVYAQVDSSSYIDSIRDLLLTDSQWESLGEGTWSHGYTRLLRLRTTANPEAYPCDTDTILSFDFTLGEAYFETLFRFLRLLKFSSCLLISSKSAHYWKQSGFNIVDLRELNLPTSTKSKAKMYIMCIHKHRVFDTVLAK